MIVSQDWKEFIEEHFLHGGSYENDCTAGLLINLQAVDLEFQNRILIYNTMFTFPVSLVNSYAFSMARSHSYNISHNEICSFQW